MGDLPQVFAEIVALAERKGVKRIGQLPGCWEFDAGEFHVAMNGHRVPTPDAHGAEVPPFTAMVLRHGLPVMAVDPAGGSVIGGVDVEDALISALRESA